MLAGRASQLTWSGQADLDAASGRARRGGASGRARRGRGLWQGQEGEGPCSSLHRSHQPWARLCPLLLRSLHSLLSHLP